jgi:putative nucleotidyltransferase with HDIG domain
MGTENIHINSLPKLNRFLQGIVYIIVSVTLIVLAMPNTDKPLLTYTVGEPWTSQQVISPGEIYIQKDPAVVEQERAELLRQDYFPYYNIDKTVGEKQISLFLQKYSDGAPGVSAYSMQVVANIMRDMYDQGIMNQMEYQKIVESDSITDIMLVKDNEAVKAEVAMVMSTKKAYELLMDDPLLVTIKTTLQELNLNEFLVANITYDYKRSKQAYNELTSLISTNSGVMKQGQEIINRGEIVTEEKARMIDSYNDFISNNSERTLAEAFMHNGMQWLYILLIMLLFMCYLQYFREEYLVRPSCMVMLFTLLTLFPIINSLLVRWDPRNVYLLPVCMVPMFVRVFLDSRSAFMAHTTLVLLCSVIVSERFEYIVLQISAGYIAICALREVTKRSQIIVTSACITLLYLVTYTLLKYMDNDALTFEILKHGYLLFIISGMMLMLTFPLMFLVEKTFGFVSPVTLMELSDINKELLRRLSEEAPGTYQHSIMVSNLASAIAQEVGAKFLLVRTGALYHDVGKLANPVFFTENQNGINPHTRLTPQESARIITGHVEEGIRLTSAAGIPSILQDFIRTHHGRGLARYFYTTYKNEHQDEEIDETPFRYKGPNPFTKEQAILMMTDAVEASSRSLKEYTEESITKLVNNIIDNQVKEGFFEDCPITFKDIKTAKEVLIDKLKIIFHTRIAYPEEKGEVKR